MIRINPHRGLPRIYLKLNHREFIRDMNLKNLFENLDKSPENKETWRYAQTILEAVGLCGDFDSQQCAELECFWGKKVALHRYGCGR